ncbi:MAG: hypothetical protein HFG28_16170 [Eubacterium sp.]|nr:hypothetical protein [Eubacterium sp.]
MGYAKGKKPDSQRQGRPKSLPSPELPKRQNAMRVTLLQGGSYTAEKTGIRENCISTKTHCGIPYDKTI